MKKVWMILLCLLLCLPAASADSEIEMRYGDILYFLPDYPESTYKVPEMDGWTDHKLVIGTMEGAYKYEVYRADLTGTMALIQDLYPAYSTWQVQSAALEHLASFVIVNYGMGTFQAGMPEYCQADGQSYTVLPFSYTYPDEVGVSYVGKGVLHEGKAVLVTGQDCAALQQAMSAMTVLTNAQTQANYAKPQVSIILGDMQFTFPEPPLKYGTSSHAMYWLFTSDFSHISVEYVAADIAGIWPEARSLDEALVMECENAAVREMENGYVTDYRIEKVEEGLYHTVFNNAQVDDDISAVQHLYVTAEGVYYVDISPTEAGFAFMESIEFKK